MAKYKKLDEKDILITDEKWTPAQAKAFSEFLRSRKEKQMSQKKNVETRHGQLRKKKSSI